MADEVVDSKKSSVVGSKSAVSTTRVGKKSTEENADKTAKKNKCLTCIKSCCWGRKKSKEDTGNEQEEMVKQTFKELLIYFVFLIIIMCITLTMVDQTNFYVYTFVMRTLFVDRQGSSFQKPDEPAVAFRDITTVSDFWKYVQGPLITGLYWNHWYNTGKSGTNHKGDPLDKFDNDTNGNILYENKLLGPPRIRQIRIKTNSCEVNEEFANFITECYGEYSLEWVDKSDFAQRNRTGVKNSPWVYRSEEELGGWPFWGSQTERYEGGGYAKDLSQDSAEATAKTLQELESNLWIRRGARVVFVDFTTYNANINLFCVFVLCVEFPATGGARPIHSLNTVKLIRYHTSVDTFVLACEFLFLLFTFYYILEEVIEIINVGWRHFLDIWNIIDLMLIIMGLLCAATNIYRYLEVQDHLKRLNANPREFQNFFYLSQVETFFNILLAILTFLAWVKVFKYISFNKTMTQLSTTLSRCHKDLLGFFIMFFIVFIAFTQLGYLLFGTQVKDFSTFVASFFTLFRIILGDFDFHQLEQANRILGPVFFMLFVFFVFFVLINMFLAIINDTYSEVKSDMSKQVDVFIMSDYLKQIYNKFQTRVGIGKDKQEELERELQEQDRYHRLHWREFQRDLLKQGYHEEEITDVFDKYDVDKDRKVEGSEQKKILAELERQRASGEHEKKKKESDHGRDKDILIVKDFVTMADFTSLSIRVDKIEKTMHGVMGNIDAVLSQMVNLK